MSKLRIYGYRNKPERNFYTNTRVEVGLNMKGVKGTDRILELPAGQMCQYKVKVTDAAEVDKELLGWIRQAFDSAA